MTIITRKHYSVTLVLRFQQRYVVEKQWSQSIDTSTQATIIRSLMLISAGKEQWDQLPLSWPPAVLNTCVQVVPPLRPKDHYPVHPHPSTYLQAKIHLRTSSSPILRNLSELGVICIFCHGMRSQSRMTMAGIRGFVPPNLTTLFNEQNLKPKTIFLSSPWWLFPKFYLHRQKQDEKIKSLQAIRRHRRMHACMHAVWRV
jgi:hypothetical protein